MTTKTTPAQIESALIQSFKAARRVSTPLVAIETPDAAATIASIRRVLNDKTPTLAWDCAKGMRGLNKLGETAVAALGIDPNATVDPTEALLAAENLPESSVLFLHNLHLHLKTPSVLQALWNLRDLYKMNKRMIVGTGPAFMLPAELAGDIIVLDEPLPTRAELAEVIDQQHKNANLPPPDADMRTAALDAVVGLPHYTAEQVYAMSLERTGANIAKCWDRKIKTLEGTKGVKVYKPLAGETGLQELKGIDNAVAFAHELIEARAFNMIAFLDEMDKSFAGGMAEHVGDSGVGKDQVGQVLTYINDTKSLGMMLAGVAGAGKTQLAKAMAAASGKPLVILDLGGAKGGVVGESEAAIRAILKVITATAEGRVLFIGTANRTTMFTPELNRRFADQFFFDLPDDAARAAIWPVYIQKCGLTAAQAAIPAGMDAGWTGAEIQRACERAALFNKSVVEAARFIIPQAVSAKATIDTMRRESAGRFLSASYSGFYQIPGAAAGPVLSTQRQIEVQ